MENMKAWVGSRVETQAVPVCTVPAAEHQAKQLNICSPRHWMCHKKRPALHVNQT